MKTFISYILILSSLIILDALWLGVVSKGFYKEHIGHLFRDKPIWSVIAVFYLLYSIGILYFSVLPADGSWTKALLLGMVLGFISYMTYDLVNYATLKDWPLVVVIIDILWGSFITGVAAVMGSIVL